MGLVFRHLIRVLELGFRVHDISQRLHIAYHYGIGPQKTILIMVLGSLIP